MALAFKASGTMLYTAARIFRFRSLPASYSEGPFRLGTPPQQKQTPKTTKPLTSFEIRGSGYIEFGGEGEIRIKHPFRSIAPVLRGSQREKWYN